MIDLKIRNATSAQWPIVADIARANLGLVEKFGPAGKVGLASNGFYIWLSLTKSGKSAVAYVSGEAAHE
tara:strand:- start:4071 stop:4277 length:207 start_codon:yes stop_codon:yes gene_type:complete